jgi:hypothetical protein
VGWLRLRLIDWDPVPVKQFVESCVLPRAEIERRRGFGRFSMLNSKVHLTFISSVHTVNGFSERT